MNFISIFTFSLVTWCKTLIVVICAGSISRACTALVTCSCSLNVNTTISMEYQYAKQVPIDVYIQNQCTVYSSCLYLETQKSKKPPFRKKSNIFITYLEIFITRKRRWRKKTDNFCKKFLFHRKTYLLGGCRRRRRRRRHRTLDGFCWERYRLASKFNLSHWKVQLSWAATQESFNFWQNFDLWGLQGLGETSLKAFTLLKVKNL